MHQCDTVSDGDVIIDTIPDPNNESVVFAKRITDTFIIAIAEPFFDIDVKLYVVALCDFEWHKLSYIHPELHCIAEWNPKWDELAHSLTKLDCVPHGDSQSDGLSVAHAVIDAVAHIDSHGDAHHLCVCDSDGIEIQHIVTLGIDNGIRYCLTNADCYGHPVPRADTLADGDTLGDGFPHGYCDEDVECDPHTIADGVCDGQSVADGEQDSVGDGYTIQHSQCDGYIEWERLSDGHGYCDSFANEQRV